jgi:hypothetical protein
MVKDGESQAEGEEDMIDYDQEDLDSDEEQDFESAESGSIDGDSYYGDQSAGRKEERTGSDAGGGAGTRLNKDRKQRSA